MPQTDQKDSLSLLWILSRMTKSEGTPGAGFTQCQGLDVLIVGSSPWNLEGALVPALSAIPKHTYCPSIKSFFGLN